MSKLVWIHKFNNNELGISETDGTGRGSFCLVPVDARSIFPELSEMNDFKSGVKLYINRAFRREVNFSKPASKTEYRLSLPQEIQRDDSGVALIDGNTIASIYQYEDGVNIDINNNQLNLSEFLEEFRARRGSNNSIAEFVVDEIIDENLNFFDASENVRLSKPFLLLAGISGTGKTRFVREQAKVSGSLSENYSLISVRPDWHEPSDLLGYISYLSGSTKYITTDVLNFIVKAWKRIIDSDLILQVENIDGYGDRFIVSGNHEQLSQVPPFWLCLDEMNLAPVEQYFADYLSVLETREWIWNEGRFKYTTDPLLKASILNQVENKECLREQLGLAEPKYDEAWNLFLVHGLGIPFNLIVAGTVNMDETTHGFSRKVIDRALSFDFGEFFPADYNHYFESSTQNKTLTYPIFSYVKISNLPVIDASGEKSIGFLKLINQVLDKTPFKLAYRALNELLLAVVSQKPTTHTDLIAVWDDFLMCKVLPRIEGDNDKLMNDRSHESLLQQLCALIQDEFLKLAPTSHVSNEDGGVIIQRVDLYRQLVSGENRQLLVKSRSLEKLRWMQNRLENFGFTSFWP
ncbi:McrB family protein [Acinetobacter junii]|uniref:McrB family protein n=1 Tax=Acinetobacter junii TaxID=40215 RepID=UPI003A8B9170